MLDYKYIRENAEAVKQNTLERGMESSVVDKWLKVDEQRLEAQQKLDALNRDKNELAELGKKGGNIEEIRAKGKELKEKSKTLEDEYNALDVKWHELINQIPNIHRPEVPVGKSEDENVEIRKVGDVPEFDFEPKDHLELGEIHDMIDFERGAKVSGSQFYFLKNDAVRLELALLQFGIDFLEKEGFEIIMTPDMAKSRFYLGTGFAPKGEEAQIYEIKDEDLGLITTAEITMAGYHADEIFKPEDLPKKYAAISHCYRKEAGAYGKYSKGLYRVHQFTKLEMFSYCTPEDSPEMHLHFLEMEEKITQALDIPYRVLEMCSGDLGAIASRKYDLEAWMPGRDDYGEITSTSNTDDFQARNMNIRVKTDKGNEYVHMLNGTALVSSRIPVAIMENFQEADGRIRIPDALVGYMGGQKYIG